MKQILLLVFLIAGLFDIAYSQTEPTDTDDDGFINISTLDHLRWISENPGSWNSCFEIDNDIDASGTKNWNDGKGFSPLGNTQKTFGGRIDGYGHSIYGLYINRPSETNVGFIGVGQVRLAEINFENIDITGGNATGGIVGHIFTGDIYKCKVTGEVTGVDNVGGIIGDAYSSNIREAEVNLMITGNDNVGGAIGKFSAYSSPTNFIRDFKAEGVIKGQYSVGGAVGYVELSAWASVQRESKHDVEIIKSMRLYNIIIEAMISGIDMVGGFAGEVSAYGATTIGDYTDYKPYTTNIFGVTGGKIGNTVTGGNSTGAFCGKYTTVIPSEKHDGESFCFHTYENCYCLTSINRTEQAPVFCGKYIQEGDAVDRSDLFRLEYCYYAGKTAITEDKNTLVPTEFDESLIKASFFDKELADYEDHYDGYGRTTAEMKSKDFFTDAKWDMVNTWDIDSEVNSGYPYLRYENAVPQAGEVPIDSDYDGYLNISTLEHLKWVSENVNSWTRNFELDNDIDASATKDWNDGAGFSPIGNEENPYMGHFIGQGNIISGLYINRDTEDNIGLFGVVKYAKISVINLTDFEIKGHNNVGAIAGSVIDNYHDKSTIEYCNTKGKINAGYGMRVGGIAGSIYGTIRHCTAEGEIRASKEAGGIAGYISGEIKYCSTDVTIIGEDLLGGLAGYLSAQVDNCSAKSVISGRSLCGGVTGQTRASGIGYIEIRNCEVDTKIQVNMSQCGGICGNVTASGENGTVLIENCNITGTLMAESRYAGGVCGDIHAYVDGYTGNGGKIKVTNVHVKMNISGDSNIGGFTGYKEGGVLIEKSSFVGIINGRERVGGFAGRSTNGFIRNCYSRGEIYGSLEIGSYIGDSENEDVKNCYSTMMTISEQGQIPAPFGSIEEGSTEACFYLSGDGTADAEYAFPKTDAMLKEKSTFADAGWDFTDIWSIDGSTNDGFPYLGASSSDVEEITPISDMFVYPNPAESMINIDVKPGEVYSVFSSTGELVLCGIGGQVNISSLPVGSYYIRVQMPNEVRTGMFLKK
jgi:hypothetical protein